jgi:hypothetical protein
MLQTQTVEPGTLDILKKLMELPELTDFLLVGGSALSLLYGHRLSVDLDLFSSVNFDNEALAGIVEKSFKNFTYRSVSNPIGLFGFIGDVKVDFVKYHRHPAIAPTILTDGIRLMSMPDIIAMKVNAVMKRGVKKDFWDIAELLQHYSIKDFISFYEQKFPTQHLLISVPQAITYFDDAEESEDPISLKGQTWETVKKFIQQKVSEFLR